MTVHSRQIHLASRPTGWPTPANFRLVETELPDPADGQIVVRNRYLSVDPYMRGRMNDVKSYIPPFVVGEALDGGAIGEVIQSRSPDRSVGDLVLSNHGWRDVTVVDAARTRVVDGSLVSPSHYLGALGVTGLTAYVGLVDIAALTPGDIVFVSGAAGAVGSLAGQLARLLGAARVVGSAGSAAKVSYLESLGFDAAFDYHDGPVEASLRAAAPDGIDVYFDNVGGEHLEAALARLHTFGRVALCGAVSQYNTERPAPGPANLGLAIGKQLTLRGFIVTSFEHRRPEFVDRMATWIRDDAVRLDETIVDSLENTPDAFIRMLRGENIGKMVVRLG